MKIILRSASVGSRWLEFSDLTDRGDIVMVASLMRDGEENAVELERMIQPYREDMLGFFEEMAEEADGWEGSKRWRSEFAEMNIVATNEGSGIATLRIQIWPPNEEWSAEETLDVSTESLTQAAASMKVLLGLKHGRRFRQLR